MSSISMMEARMPPGFRFHPRDDELVLDYLLHKLTGRRPHGGATMLDVDLNKCEPWDLPEAACVGGKEWYFFNQRDRKYATGQRTNRATRSGYWKATGKDRAVVAAGSREDAAPPVVGMRKTLVFYRGRAPKGRKTEWVMHEFRLEQPPAAAAPPWPGRELPAPPARHQRPKEDWVLCRVFYKSRTTTPNLPSEDAKDGAPSTELDNLPVAPFSAEAAAPAVPEQVPRFSGLPADLLAFDTSNSDKVSTSSSSVLELPPNCNWNQENGLPHLWNPLGI